jgi:hypothetical protein
VLYTSAYIIHGSEWSLQIPGLQHPLNLPEVECEDVDGFVMLNLETTGRLF